MLLRLVPSCSTPCASPVASVRCASDGHSRAPPEGPLSQERLWHTREGANHSHPVVCSSRSTTRPGSVASQRFSNETSGASLRIGSCRDSFPSFASFRTESETNAFDVEPMRNSVSGVTGVPLATLAVPPSRGDPMHCRLSLAVSAVSSFVPV